MFQSQVSSAKCGYQVISKVCLWRSICCSIKICQQVYGWLKKDLTNFFLHFHYPCWIMFHVCLLFVHFYSFYLHYSVKENVCTDQYHNHMRHTNNNHYNNCNCYCFTVFIFFTQQNQQDETMSIRGSHCTLR